MGEDRSGAAGPLEGLRVLELGTLIAGPFAGRLLGDFGAEVIKVEAPGQRDPMREWGRRRYAAGRCGGRCQSRNKKLRHARPARERGPGAVLRARPPTATS